MDNPVCPDGYQRSEDQSRAAIAPAQPGAESVRRAARREFLLESDLLQRKSVWLRVFMAASALVSGSVDDPDLLESRSAGSIASDPLPAVADLCGIPELWGLDAELTEN